MPQDQFDKLVAQELRSRHEKTPSLVEDPPVAVAGGGGGGEDNVTESETFTLVTDSTSAEIRNDLAVMQLEAEQQQQQQQQQQEGGKMEADGTKAVSESPFIQGLLNHDKGEPEPPNMENKMYTENDDIAYRSTTDSVVDLFAELEDVVSGPRLRELLDSAWAANPLMTLKIIFNARSIHLGKSSSTTFYRAAGWLAENHPHTLIANLRWLTRPVIEKKQEQKQKEEDDDEDGVVLVDKMDEVEDRDEAEEFDVRHGVSHGYWKDLLNILALAVNGKLRVMCDPSDVLNTGNPRTIYGKKVPAWERQDRAASSSASASSRKRARGKGVMVDAIVINGRGNAQPAKVRTQMPEPGTLQDDEAASVEAKEHRRKLRERRHARVVKAFKKNVLYRALHLTVARLFAEQIQKDLAKLRVTDPRARKTISLCAKWAPSSDRFHDRHTWVTSSIAEIMHPRDSLGHILTATDDRATYLQHAREAYRQDISALRKHLEVVERDISANTFDKIRYDRVPSLAMKNYTPIFISKDMDHFEAYLDRVVEGKANISGATLLPSTMVREALAGPPISPLENLTEDQKRGMSAKQLLDMRVLEQKMRAADAQWKTMARRVKDSGCLSSSIAVCDVSGSMYSPTFRDGTRPLDTAMGLSLLVSEVTEPPFAGCVIDFSNEPRVNNVSASNTLQMRVHQLRGLNMGTNTDFVAVFEDLILPMAKRNRLTQEQMVKRVFVFSDMQFDQADRAPRRPVFHRWFHEKKNEDKREHNHWDTAYERIRKLYRKAGYEMPEMVFWNLAGGRAGYNGGGGNGGGGDPVAPKPVTATEKGTSLVSGYSQGMLKVFMDNGGFEDPESDEEEDMDVDADADAGQKEEEDEDEGEMANRSKMDPLRIVKKAVGHKAYHMLRVYD
jgi:hypothetical protein